MPPTNTNSNTEFLSDVRKRKDKGTTDEVKSTRCSCDDAHNRLPANPPPFTVADLRNAIPAHCFKRSIPTSFRYLFVDLLGVAVMLYLSTFIEPTFTDERFGSTAGFFLRHAAWTAYWLIQGNIMTGLWVIGHECGHGGFADSELLNDIVGFITHSFLLVPYFSWKISHRRHHSNTGNVDRDEVFVPAIKEQPSVEAAAVDAQGHEPHSFAYTLRSVWRSINTAFRIFIMLTLGWPLYLFFNATGHRNYPKNAWVNHFNPSSPIFIGKGEPTLVFLSDLGLLAVLFLWGLCIKTFTFGLFFKVYGIPYLYTNLNLVLITFLQHTDVALPHFKEGEWEWLRGALATVDRDYGILNYFHHHIADTHVLHHIFFNLPHYHAEEATRAIIPLLGSYYRYDKTPIAVALWRSFRDCNEVAPDPHASRADPHAQATLWFNADQFQR